MRELFNFLLVGAGGFLGSVGRYGVALAMKSCPLAATFTANAAGSLIMGVVISLCAHHSPSYLLLAVGFCGGFTTFSSFSSENIALLRSGNYAVAGLYILTTVALTLCFVWVGIKFGAIIKNNW